MLNLEIFHAFTSNEHHNRKNKDPHHEIQNDPHRETSPLDLQILASRPESLLI